jgi:hypothetical protein
MGAETRCNTSFLQGCKERQCSRAWHLPTNLFFGTRDEPQTIAELDGPIGDKCCSGASSSEAGDQKLFILQLDVVRCQEWITSLPAISLARKASRRGINGWEQDEARADGPGVFQDQYRLQAAGL